MGEDCYKGSGLIGSWEDKYELRSTDVVPTRGQTSSVRGNDPLMINIMQPTLFVGNLFIYASNDA